MPLWTVETRSGEEERVEADLLALQGEALIALSEAGDLLRAWASGHWRTARLLSGIEAHPAAQDLSENGILVRLPLDPGLST